MSNIPVTVIIPTRDRHEVCLRTLERLPRLPDGSEVLVMDDASTPAFEGPRVAGGCRVQVSRTLEPRGASIRTHGAQVAAHPWLLMLDDDSWPVDTAWCSVLAEIPPEVVAVGGEIRRTADAGGGHEAGGLPEVIVGCGALVRRDAFLGVGGYDRQMQYYAEEYDLCARFLACGFRVEHDGRLRVLHARTAVGRNADRMVELLTRNNAWVIQRYAPEAVRERALARALARVSAIASRESATAGLMRGRQSLADSLPRQPRMPLTEAQWRRFTGEAACDGALADLRARGITRCRLVHRGKHAEYLADAAADHGIEIAPDGAPDVPALVGTLSPGPIMDALAVCASRPVVHGCGPVAEDRRMVHAPWRPPGFGETPWN